MAKVYFQDEASEILRIDLFDIEAERDANRLLEAKVTRVQARKYFNEIRALQARLKSERQRDPQLAFARVEPYLKLLKAKAHYGTRNADLRALSSLLIDCVDGATTEPRFNAMVKYFEAVIAYFVPKAKG